MKLATTTITAPSKKAGSVMQQLHDSVRAHMTASGRVRTNLFEIIW
jgi:hypothetical protein